jgi:D-alanyl-D-alanine carboxypeptidase
MAGEARETRRQRKLFLAMMVLVVMTAVMSYLVYYFVLRSHDYELSYPFRINDTVYGVRNGLQLSDTADSFASGLCVTDSNVNVGAVSLGAYEAALFDLSDQEVDYAKNIFESRSPASLTKIMTALVALKYGNLDDMVTVTETALDIEYGSSVCDIQVGDRLSLRQLLYGLMIASGNDAAMMIAEYVGGSVENFVAMMNEEALALGATGTHFANPHGLTASGHYTTAYDLYLIFREAMQYDVFMDIINRKNYYAEYTREDGSAVAVTWESTNHYFTGEADSPDHVIIYGGKTGTTEDAGACLVLLTKDLYGNPYLSIILHSDTKDLLYLEMNQLLNLIEN